MNTEAQKQEDGSSLDVAAGSASGLRAVCSRIIDAVLEGETRPLAIAAMLNGVVALDCGEKLKPRIQKTNS